MKILLIAGGWSSERDISINGAKSVETALKNMGHDVSFLDLEDNFDNLMDIAVAFDFAFINLHGSPGEDGLVQAMLEKAGCPYQGAGPTGSFLALNKAATKQLYRFNNLPTPDWEFLPTPPAESWRPSLPYPLFVKSNTGGSSLRLCKVQTFEELRESLKEIFAAGEEALIETAIKGQDITCGVLGSEALPPVLIEPVQGEYFDFNSKYAKGGAKETCPAPISAEITLAVQKLALSAHTALGLQGCSRTDFIRDENDDLYLLETNTLPGMTATSLVPQEAAAIGLSFEKLLARLIELGLADHRKK